MKEFVKVFDVVSLNTIKTYALKIGTHVRLNSLNYYSTHDKLIKFFGLEHYCDETSKALKQIGCYRRLERIHKKWQVTEYTIEGYAFTSNPNVDDNERKLVYYIKSIDNKSHILVSEDCVEEIQEFSSPWTIE